MSKGENIVKWIKGQRISLLGHPERMEEDNRMPKKIFNQELDGTRRSGRPRKGWKEEVERDLQVLGVRTRELVADRKKMEGRCSTGQSPQWAVVPTEEEETVKNVCCCCCCCCWFLWWWCSGFQLSLRPFFTAF